MFAPFAAHYTEQRKAAGLTHTAVCAEVGAHGEVNHGGASVNWEAGYNVPTMAQWEKLVPLLDLSEDWLPLIERVEGEREKIGEETKARSTDSASALPTVGAEVEYRTWDLTASATPEAAQWEGWGTSLKPGHEPVVVARKPLSGTVAQNVLQFSTGALNIDATRISSGQRNAGRWPSNVALSHLPECERVGVRKVKATTQSTTRVNPLGMMNDDGWEPQKNDRPATINANSDGTETIPAYECAPGCPVAELDEQSGERGGSGRASGPTWEGRAETYSGSWEGTDRDAAFYGDTGGASRFFASFSEHGLSEGVSDPGPGSLAESEPRFRYCAKASRGERNAGLEGFEERKAGAMEGPNDRKARSSTQSLRDTRLGDDYERPETRGRNHHPTVKPIDLMRWLVRLVTPPGGTVLDPFVGSGTTGCAAVLEGFDFIGIEREAEYVEIAKARIAWWSQFPGEDTGEILGRASASERIKREHTERGQMGFDYAQAQADKP
jgi:hypothetical protein